MNLRVIKLTLSFIAALLISSVCGTQYLFSAYSTTLAERLNFSSIQINTIGSAANYGVYLGKPIFGYIADNFGGRRPFFAAFIIFIGYFCLAMTYEGSLRPSFLLCAFYMFLAGMASAAGKFLCLLALIAKNITSFRGISLGAPIALSGLSAAIYSEINSLWFKNDTYHFLLFLAISAGLCIFIGSWFLVVVPPSINQDTTVVTLEEGNSSSCSTKQNDKFEDTPLLQNKINEEIDIGGWDFINNIDAKLLAITMFFFSGAGLMYINNVGTIIESLYSSHSSSTLPPIYKLQNTHVFVLSIFSCLGRLSIGFISDMARLLFKIPRSFFFILSGVWIFLAQLLILFYVDDLDKLLIVTIFVGVGFGNLYSITPIIVSEWFGTKRFGSNWGMIACIPAFGGQLFNLLFGYNNDQHKRNECTGTDCYITVYYFSSCACLLSICISLSLFY
ncbi:MFS general substrate transporter, partial [Rhizophagus irregularis]